MADAAKALGNDAFKAQNYDEAIKHFTDAINIDGSNHVLYSNRSAAYSAKKDYDNALTDAEKCISITPSFAKGYSRKGAALQGLRRIDDAIQTYEKGLELDPNSQMLKNGLEEAKASQGGGGGGGLGDIGNMFSSPDVWGKIASNPSTAAFLQQPDFVQAITALQQNPNKLGDYLKDPRIMQVMGVLMGVNIQTAPPGDMGAAAAAASQPAKKEPEPEPEPEIELTPEEKELKEKKDKANAVKAEGNTKYKAKEFDAAIAKYTEAIEIFGDDLSYYTNRAAVYYEKKEYTTCIEDCKKAIEVGKENRASFAQIAKAWARIGNAHHQMKAYPEAIRAYETSLMEDRNKEVESKMKKVIKEQKEHEKNSYLNPEEGEKAREKGNELFKAGKYTEAIECYSDAMKRNPDAHMPYGNRAACYQKLMEWQLAVKDCETCVKMCPTYIKGWTRKAAVHYFLKEYHKALQCYEEVLKQDPENAEAKDGIQRTTAIINESSGGEVDQERAARAMADPEIQAILSDPMMRQVLNDMQTDPKKSQHYLKDADVQAKLQKLIAAGVLQVK